MVRRYFDIPEAESILSTISPLVLRAQQLKQRLESYERISLKKRMMTDGSESFDFSDLDGILDTQFATMKQDFYEAIERVEKEGCVIRDLDDGFIDFHTKFQGRDVFLSWCLGERKISFWHECDDDESGRQKILELR